MTPNADFIVSTEEECLTAVEGTDELDQTGRAAGRFLDILRTVAPSLHCVSNGVFNGYGRVYLDHGGHVELAAIECACPYALVEVRARQHELVRRAAGRLAEEHCRLVLANNNHSGLLTGGARVWGAHENYLVENHPTRFGAEILPFLVTRIFAGAGGVHHPTGAFLAAVRPEFMAQAVGGKTTERRAIHSTARDEHHQGPDATRYRYHLILGDGHRSQFNLALQLGATALALKAIFFDAELRSALEKYREPPLHDCWVKTMQELNRLAIAGEELRVHPLVLEIQRLYLAGARRYHEALDGSAPAWVPRLLADWENTLDALERRDREWLAARLDAFAKYEFYSAFLTDAGESWETLPASPDLFFELALLDQSYHELTGSESIFNRMEEADLLQHRVGEGVTPGEEAEPFVPDTQTRARARARFIRENVGEQYLLMDWSWVQDISTGRRKDLWDPFASAYGPWKSGRRSPLFFMET